MVAKSNLVISPPRSDSRGEGVVINSKTYATRPNNKQIGCDHRVAELPSRPRFACDFECQSCWSESTDCVLLPVHDALRVDVVNGSGEGRSYYCVAKDTTALGVAARRRLWGCGGVGSDRLTVRIS